MGNRCEGHCCESFSIDRAMVWKLLTQGYEGHANPEEDSYKVIRMIKTTDARPEGQEGEENKSLYFTCKKYDPETKSCTDYENRPNMCRNYPSGNRCEYKNCCWDKVNGKEEKITAEISIARFLQIKGINHNIVACELNFSVIRRKNLGEVTLKQGDTLEVIHMMGGG